MRVCRYRPDEASSFVACATAFLDRSAVCSGEVLEDDAARVIVAEVEEDL